jgi:hypothetical protein
LPLINEVHGVAKVACAAAANADAQMATLTVLGLYNGCDLFLGGLGDGDSKHKYLLDVMQ